MADSEADKTFDVFRYDLVEYLARRLGIPREVALRTLGDWLVYFRPEHAADDGADLSQPPGDADASDEQGD